MLVKDGFKPKLLWPLVFLLQWYLLVMIIFGPKVDSAGPKKFVFLGGILFGAGMFATGFATTLPVLYLTYGVVLGLGIGSAYGASTSVATKWFPDKKGLAGGLTAAGFGLGPLIIGPVAKSLIASMGVYSTFKVLGIILLIVILYFFIGNGESSCSCTGSWSISTRR